MIDTKLSSKKLLDSSVMAQTAPRLTVNGSANGASKIEFKHMSFLITDRPTEATIERYIEVLNKNKVKDVVRVCDPTYDANRLQDVGITVIDWPTYEDGQVPPKQVLDEWLSLVRTRLSESPHSCIAVHCVAGLGRAPVLVAIALMELGMKYDEAIELIRLKRRGALNQNQLEFLKLYRAKSRLATAKKADVGCSIM